jgi:uncharacterized membrane protein YozB (DUF420 family)
VVDLLPHVTAALNALAAVLLLTGYTLIRLKKRQAHHIVMTSAVVVSALFLISYIIHHIIAPLHAFPGHGIMRPIYFTLLVSHVGLSIAVTPMVIITYMRGSRREFDRHRALARWTFPIWLYVSVTGILVYVLLYQVYGLNT